MVDGARGLPAEPSGASNVQELHAYSSYQSPAGDPQADSQAQSVRGHLLREASLCRSPE